MAFSCIMECAKPEIMEKILDPFIIEKIAAFLNSEIKSLRHAAIYFTGTISCSPDIIIDKFLEYNPLPSIKQCLERTEDKEVLVDIVFSLKNLLLGPFRWLKEILNTGICTTLIRLLKDIYTTISVILDI